MIPSTLPTGAEEITVSNTAKTLLAFIQDAGTAPSWKPRKGSNSFQIQVKTGSIRYHTGFTPTTANGMLITTGNAGETLLLPLDAIKLIRNGGSDATITVQVFEDNTII